MKKRIALLVCLFLAAALLPLTLHTASADTTYTVTWLNDDGTLLATTQAAEGETPVYPYDPPTKETDADYIYTFLSWDPEPEPATADATYTAVYSAVERPDKCGDTLYWSFDEESGTLTFTGSGAMYDYERAPWYDRRNSILAVELPDGLTAIGRNAFYNLNYLRGVTIPDSVINIGASAFYDCRSMTSAAIGNGVENIGIYAFYRCVELESLTFGNSLLCIGNGAFFACRQLREITLPDSVTCIYAHAFEQCYQLSSITIGNNITIVSRDSFLETEFWNTHSEGPIYLDYILLGYKNLYPNKLNIKSSTRVIATYAFESCTTIKELIIPDSVEKVNWGAFYGCTGLTSVTMPCSVILENDAFTGCSAISNVHLTKGTGTMQDETSLFRDFHYNSDLTVTIDDEIENIGAFAFSGCVGLREIAIPDSVTRIGRLAFQVCTNLTTVSIGSGLRTVESEAFDWCSELKDVYYNGTRSDRANHLAIDDYRNESLLNATWHYLTEDVSGAVEWNAEDVLFSGTTPYVVANGKAQTPRFTVKNQYDLEIDPAFYDCEYRENTNAGTAYVVVTFKGDYAGTCLGWFKIYLPPTDYTAVENRNDGIYMEWHAVPGAAGYVIYRRAWSSTTDGWTDFVRWNNTTALNWTDKTVYAGTRYQYGIKAYFAPRIDPVTGATIGGNVGDNYNLGRVGPLKTTVRITTRKLNSVTGGTKQITAKWSGSSVFTGYQVQVATDKAFKNIVKTVKITKSNVYQTTVKNLNAKTTYYVRVRSYHVFNGMTYYGGWSNVLSGKTK